jgi:hypothetical protein
MRFRDVKVEQAQANGDGERRPGGMPEETENGHDNIGATRQKTNKAPDRTLSEGRWVAVISSRWSGPDFSPGFWFIELRCDGQQLNGNRLADARFRALRETIAVRYLDDFFNADIMRAPISRKSPRYDKALLDDQ